MIVINSRCVFLRKLAARTGRGEWSLYSKKARKRPRNWRTTKFSMILIVGIEITERIAMLRLYHFFSPISRIPNDRFNSTDMRKEREIRSSSNGYLTMINTRHPLARLLSAWHDKFRKGHPWMKFIEKRYGDILSKLERRDMTKGEKIISLV